MTKKVQSSLNALVLTLSQATPGEEFIFNVEGNDNTVNYVYCIMKLMGIDVVAFKKTTFTIVFPKELTFPAKENISKFFMFVHSYAEDVTELSPLILRKKVLELTEALRDASEDDVLKWRAETHHKWEKLDDSDIKPVKITEEAKDEKKPAAPTSAGMKWGLVILFLLLSLATTIFSLSNNGMGGARGDFYNGNFVMLFFKSPAIMLDTVISYLYRIPFIGPWMPFVFPAVLFVYGLKRIFRKTLKTKKTIKQRILSMIANLPYTTLKVWLWVSFIYYCLVIFA